MSSSVWIFKHMYWQEKTPFQVQNCWQAKPSWHWEYTASFIVIFLQVGSTTGVVKERKWKTIAYVKHSFHLDHIHHRCASKETGNNSLHKHNLFDLEYIHRRCAFKVSASFFQEGKEIFRSFGAVNEQVHLARCSRFVK